MKDSSLLVVFIKPYMLKVETDTYVGVIKLLHHLKTKGKKSVVKTMSLKILSLDILLINSCKTVRTKCTKEMKTRNISFRVSSILK